MSPRKDRKGRVQDMLEALGSSVLSGAATTMGAAVFTLFGNIQFFHQFGVFLFSVIGFSLAFSLGFFSTALAIIGPNGDVGSFAPLFRCARKGIQKLRNSGASEKTPCDNCDGKGYIDRDMENKNNAAATVKENSRSETEQTNTRL